MHVQVQGRRHEQAELEQAAQILAHILGGTVRPIGRAEQLGQLPEGHLRPLAQDPHDLLQQGALTEEEEVLPHAVGTRRGVVVTDHPDPPHVAHPFRVGARARRQAHRELRAQVEPVDDDVDQAGERRDVEPGVAAPDDVEVEVREEGPAAGYEPPERDRGERAERARLAGGAVHVLQQRPLDAAGALVQRAVPGVEIGRQVAVQRRRRQQHALAQPRIAGEFTQVGAGQAGLIGHDGGAAPEFLVIGGALVEPAEQGGSTLVVEVRGERPG